MLSEILIEIRSKVVLILQLAANLKELVAAIEPIAAMGGGAHAYR